MLTAEALADGQVSDMLLGETRQLVQSLISDDAGWSEYSLIAWALHKEMGQSYPLDFVMMWAIPSVIEAGLASSEEVIAALDCIFGPLPFRSSPPLSRFMLDWNDGTVVKLANTIYDDRAFDRLPILADALQDAGCQDADILGHCRHADVHVRGCWVVDLLTGRK